MSLSFGLVLRDGPYTDLKEHRMRNFFECSNCGHISVDLFEPERHDHYYRRLEMTYYEQHDQDVRRYKRTLDLLPRGKIRRVLDIGCGSGTFLKMLPESIERFGVEPSKIAARKAKDSGINILSFEDLRKPDLRGTFDVVAALDVVEHTKQLTQFRECFCDALRPGGTLVLLTGDCASNSARRLGRYWYYMHYAEHVTFFSHRSVKLWLDSEFQDIEVVPTSHHPLDLGEIVAIAKSWLLFPAKIAANKLSMRVSSNYVALWTARDHMLVRATRRE